MIDDALNPLNSNHSAIGPNTHCLKVLSGFHCGAQKGIDERQRRAAHSGRTKSAGALIGFDVNS
jgi:hypothetical protein